MSDKKSVNVALERYFATLTSQISAGDQLKNAVNDLLAKKENPEFQKTGNANKIDEWDVLDQSYISIKLQNAFSEIENRAVVLKGNVTKLRKNERDVSWFETSPEEVLTLVLSLIKELHQYHKAVADCLAPLVEYAVYRQRYPTKYEMKECSSVPVTWKAVNEVNRSLRYGYGLSKEELASILAWKHGEDLSESSRKTLNQKVDNLIQTYKERLGNLDTCEVDVPIAFQLYPLVLQDVLKDCCSPVESIAAVGQTVPDKKEDLDTLILREIPRIQLKIGDAVHEVASPGKAFENTKQKMHAVRHLVSKAFKSQKVQVNKEQLDLFSLKVLATACISVANASSRTAVLMAFGKANLIQVRPFSSKSDDQPAQITLDSGSIFIEVPSQWSLVEDSDLLSSLSRDLNATLPVATVDTLYRGSFDVKAELEKRAQSLPVVRIQRCSGMVKNLDKKDQTTKGIRRRLSRATQKLFNRRSTSGIPPKGSTKTGPADASHITASGIVNLAASVQDGDRDDEEALKSGAETNTPVPPPRPRRKARKKRRSESARRQREVEEAKHDPKWFSSCRKLQAPDLTENKVHQSNSPSVASFEELQDVIDFLSGSSTSSLCLSQPLDGDKSNLRKTVASKDVHSTLAIDDQGKVSPSDSGIGSTMSMRSHPSVGSISGLSRQEKVTKIASGKTKKGVTEEKTRIILNEDGELEIESQSSDEQEESQTNITLKDKLVLETNEDSLIEDAEVEHYIRKSSSCLQLAGKRESKNEAAKMRNEDPCKTPTATRTSSASSENDKETSVQDVINDLKALGLQRSDLDVTAGQSDAGVGREKSDPTAGSFHDDRAFVEADNDLEPAVVSDHHSYDADGSEESEENNPQPDEPPRSLSSNTLHGSTESLYYSAWALNEVSTENEATSKEQNKIDDQTDSFFSDGLKEANLSESLEGQEEFHECEQPSGMLYQHFNTRFSWPAGFGDRFAAIWGGREAQEPESPSLTASSPGGVWTPGANLNSDTRHPGIQDGAQYRQMRSSGASHTNLPLNWSHRTSEESFTSQTNEEQWGGTATSSLLTQTEDVFSSDWSQRMASHAGIKRNSPLHSSLKRVGLANTSSVIPTGAWAPAMNNPPRGLGPRGQTFGRPSSVPAQISRQYAPPQSKLLYNQAGFDFDGAGAVRHAQSPPFHSTPSATAHVQYQTWSRETGSEPILGSANTRQMSEMEAMALQQNKARSQMMNRMFQQGQNNQGRR